MDDFQFYPHVATRALFERGLTGFLPIFRPKGSFNRYQLLRIRYYFLFGFIQILPRKFEICGMTIETIVAPFPKFKRQAS